MTGGTNLRALLNAARRILPIDREDAARVVDRVVSRQTRWSGALHGNGRIWSVGRLRQLGPLVDCAVDLLTDPAVRRTNFRRWRRLEIQRSAYRLSVADRVAASDSFMVTYAEILGELTFRTVEAPDPATRIATGYSGRHPRLTVFR